MYNSRRAQASTESACSSYVVLFAFGLLHARLVLLKNVCVSSSPHDHIHFMALASSLASLVVGDHHTKAINVVQAKALRDVATKRLSSD